MASVEGKVATILEMPVGISSWNTIRREHLFFVDKTGFLSELMKAGRRIFIARPRRMGKTTMCSILDEALAHGLDNFRGLNIEHTWPVTDCYPVINLSFFNLGIDVTSFEASLCKRLVDAYERVGFPVGNCKGITSFEDLSLTLDKLARERGKPLVFLIDEWDYPLSINLDKPQVFAALQHVLNNFYGWLRFQVDARFILVTGIMRYRDTSLFTGQDFQDLSMDHDFAALLGYTKEEIDECFRPYTKEAARRLGISYSEVLDKLELYYDGFCFDEDAAVKVYCPFSVNMFYSVLYRGTNRAPMFNNYWMDSAGASYALVSYLRGHDISPQQIIALSNQELVMTSDKLREVSYLKDVTLNQVLVQAGYFSIQKITAETKNKAPKGRSYSCGITNQEVREKFDPVLASYVVGFRDRDENDVGYSLAQALSEVKQGLEQGDIDLLCDSFNQVLCYLRYDTYKAIRGLSYKNKNSAQVQPQDQRPAPLHSEVQDQDKEAQKQNQSHAQVQPLGPEQQPEIEAFYRTFLKLALTSESIYTEDEVANNHGRCDLVATTKDHIYIFELKRLDKRLRSKAAITKLLDQGERQMLVKRYGNNLKKQGKPITMVVLVICDLYRQVCGWRSFKLDDALLKPNTVDSHEVVLDVDWQALAEKQGFVEPQGWVEPVARAEQAKTVVAPKGKRRSVAKASAIKGQNHKQTQTSAISKQ